MTFRILEVGTIFEFERARVVLVCAEGDRLVMASLGFGGIGTERRSWTCALKG
jgi:hypothetical protein